jgi:hypothetical protein
MLNCIFTKSHQAQKRDSNLEPPENKPHFSHSVATPIVNYKNIPIDWIRIFSIMIDGWALRSFNEDNSSRGQFLLMRNRRCSNLGIIPTYFMKLHLM